jgi:serine/threonine protein kinase
VLEYANEGNLRDYLINKFTSLEWKDKIQMALDITCGLKFLHSKEIIHRDLVKRVFILLFVIFVYDNNLIISLFL